MSTINWITNDHVEMVTKALGNLPPAPEWRETSNMAELIDKI
jgi:hypothetical protein